MSIEDRLRRGNYGAIYGIIGCLLILLGYLGLCIFIAWIAMLLWNWLAPVFWANAPILNIWQAWGAIILISLISGCFKIRVKIKD